MPDVTIQIDDRAVREMLRQAPRRVDRAMRLAMHDAVTLLTRDLREYPEQRLGSTYMRTHTLERSWSNEVRGRFSAIGGEIRGVVASNSNIAPYNRYVQDRLHQAEVHQGRWLTVQDVAERRDATIRRMFNTRLRVELG